ncbi:4'-phosphopantetheinyl transferase [Microbacterium terrae]|uniref:Uncharacterized protein n=1 Tax=Microbacterium terrae TaxID=69369 RepID=A0A0M2HD66_9MICO|nr:hypothetical protein [Microbacterium terrae]KJL42085.1 hypothetical protein RS81_01243 [Microbacterium terrae]MBP1076652.1 4'-phosphopantetheinyl transferase [Microbacterium terrae]GLJ97481.1 hypothetical protein GCM10017594_06780 [Microbacterium terrae]
MNGRDAADAPFTLRWAPLEPGVARRDIAWALLRMMLPASARLTNPCVHCGGPHGAVRIAGADAVASVTYTGGFAVVATAPRAAAASVGIDAETAQPGDGESYRGVLGPGTVSSPREWARVEAALKADGRGLRVDPAGVVVRELPLGGSGTPPHWEASVPGGGAFSGWDAAGPAGTVVSVALRPAAAEAGEAPGR